jgi:hypothetical protein
MKDKDYQWLCETAAADLKKGRCFDAAERRLRRRALRFTRGQQFSREKAGDLALQALSDAASSLGRGRDFRVYACGDDGEE